MQPKIFVKILTCLKSLTWEDLNGHALEKKSLPKIRVSCEKISLVHQCQGIVIVGKVEKDFEVARKIKTRGKDSTMF